MAFTEHAIAQAASNQASLLNDSATNNSLTPADSAVASGVLEHRQKFSLNDSRNFFQYWKDQFPSPLVMRFNGLPMEPPLEIPIRNENNDWQFWYSLFLLGMLAWIRFGYQKDFEEEINTFRNWGMNMQMARELGVGIPFGVVLLTVFSSLVISFYAFLLIVHFGWVMIQPSWSLMIASFLLVAGLLFLRYLLLKLAEMVTTRAKELKLYIYYELQINRVAGIFLFPVVLLMAFAEHPLNEYALYLSFGLVVFFLVIRYIKGFNLGFSYFGNHLFHFLIYICALEISPILIVVRLLSDINPVRFST